MPFPFPEMKNDDPFMHRTQHGTIFLCKRADLKTPVIVLTDRDNLLCEAVEFGAWHAQIVWPELNGFAGYDAIRYLTIHCEDPDEKYRQAGSDLAERVNTLCGEPKK